MPKWWPVCGHCGSEVTRIAWTADPATPKTMALRVDCHSKTETTIWPTQTVFRAMGETPFSRKAAQG